MVASVRRSVRGNNNKYVRGGNKTTAKGCRVYDDDDGIDYRADRDGYENHVWIVPGRMLALFTVSNARGYCL